MASRRSAGSGVSFRRAQICSAPARVRRRLRGSTVLRMAAIFALEAGRLGEVAVAIRRHAEAGRARGSRRRSAPRARRLCRPPARAAGFPAVHPVDVGHGSPLASAVFLKTRQLFWPPRPNEFDMSASTLSLARLCSARSRGRSSGRGTCRLIVGGMIWSRIASTPTDAFDSAGGGGKVAGHRLGRADRRCRRRARRRPS